MRDKSRPSRSSASALQKPDNSNHLGLHPANVAGRRVLRSPSAAVRSAVLSSNPPLGERLVVALASFGGWVLLR
jgi:hypothetical protein